MQAAAMLSEIEQAGMQYTKMNGDGSGGSAGPPAGKRRGCWCWTPRVKRLLLLYTGLLYALLLACSAIATMFIAGRIQSSLTSAETAIEKIDHMYAGFERVLRALCGTPDLLPPDMWALICEPAGFVVPSPVPSSM